MIETFAMLYAAICGGVIFFQIGLIAGARWGHLTQGGMRKGSLPRSGKLVAAFSIILLALMAGSILSVRGIWPHWPVWMGWVTLVIQAISALLNWITPSRAERLLWAPITTGMLVLAGLVLIA